MHTKHWCRPSLKEHGDSYVSGEMVRKEVNPGYMGGTRSDVALATALITQAPEAACLQGPHEEGLGSHTQEKTEKGLELLISLRIDIFAFSSAQDTPHCLIHGAIKGVFSRCHRKRV